MLRQRVDVIAPSTVRVVRFAGGWLFDRVMAGWDVTVHVADHADARPLQILGARALELEPALAGQVRGAQPEALAVDAELYAADARVRRMVQEAACAPLTEVWLWGEGCPADLDRLTGSVCHRLSVAARAFKAQALAAAAAEVGEIDLVETFRSNDAPAVLDFPAKPRRPSSPSSARQPAEVV